MAARWQLIIDRDGYPTEYQGCELSDTARLLFLSYCQLSELQKLVGRPHRITGLHLMITYTNGGSWSIERSYNNE